MKLNRLIAFFVILCAGFSLLRAQGYSARHDSVWVYNSWESIYYQYPDTLIINPDIEAYTPYNFTFDSHRRSVNEMLEKRTVAVAIGDTTWLVNSKYLRDHFKGDVKKMEDYVPLYFNSKLAFATCVGKPTYFGKLLGSLLGDPDLFDADPLVDTPYLFWINFEDRRVKRVNHEVLSELLSSYRNLQWRYEATVGYKNRDVIEYYFMEFVRTAERDPAYPELIDRLGTLK